MKDIIKNKISLIVLFIAITLVLYFTLKDDFEGIIDVLKNVNLLIFTFGIIVFLLALLTKALSLREFICEHNNYSLKKAYKLTLMAQFVNGITPLQTAGQPFEVYLLRKDGVRITNSTNAMIKDFISYQSALIIVEIFSIIMGINILSNNKYLNIFIFIGFIINFIILIFFLLFSFTKKLGYKLAYNIIHFLFKFKIIKKIFKDEEQINVRIKAFCKTGLELRKSKTRMIKCIIINIFYIVLTYLIPFIMFYALGVTDISFMQSFISTSFVILISNFIPTPGATGGVEYAFIKFFEVFISGLVLPSAMLLWRFVTYGLPMIIGFIILMFERGMKKR